MRLLLKLFLSICVVITAFSNTVLAQDSADPNLAAICALIDHEEQKKEIAGADYVPGVDVYGREVKAADLNAQQQSYKFDFSLELADRYLDLPDGIALNSETIPLEITANGNVRISDTERTGEFRNLCQEHYGQDDTP